MLSKSTLSIVINITVENFIPKLLNPPFQPPETEQNLTPKKSEVLLKKLLSMF